MFYEKKDLLDYYKLFRNNNIKKREILNIILY